MFAIGALNMRDTLPDGCSTFFRALNILNSCREPAVRRRAWTGDMDAGVTHQ